MSLTNQVVRIHARIGLDAVTPTRLGSGSVPSDEVGFSNPEEVADADGS